MNVSAISKKIKHFNIERLVVGLRYPDYTSIIMLAIINVILLVSTYFLDLHIDINFNHGAMAALITTLAVLLFTGQNLSPGKDAIGTILSQTFVWPTIFSAMVMFAMTALFHSNELIFMHLLLLLLLILCDFYILFQLFTNEDKVVAAYKSYISHRIEKYIEKKKGKKIDLIDYYSGSSEPGKNEYQLDPLENLKDSASNAIVNNQIGTTENLYEVYINNAKFLIKNYDSTAIITLTHTNQEPHEINIYSDLLYSQSKTIVQDLVRLSLELPNISKRIRDKISYLPLAILNRIIKAENIPAKQVPEVLLWWQCKSLLEPNLEYDNKTKILFNAFLSLLPKDFDEQKTRSSKIAEKLQDKIKMELERKPDINLAADKVKENKNRLEAALLEVAEKIEELSSE